MWKNLPFRFSPEVEAEIAKYKDSKIDKPPHALFSLYRTYSRVKDDNTKENYYEIIYRITRGVFSLIQERLFTLGHYKDEEWQEHALNFFKLVWEGKISPPGRGFWAMGTKLVNKYKIGLALVNCTFITTANIDIVKEEIFAFVFDTLMLGVGTGYDTEGAGKLKITQPEKSNYNNYTNSSDLANQFREFLNESYSSNDTWIEEEDSPTGFGILSPEPKGKATPAFYILNETNYINQQILLNSGYYKVHVVKDSREGWVDALRALVKSYTGNGYITLFDYSKVRPKGTPLKTFGGVASGPLPLAQSLSMIRYIFEKILKTPGKDALDEVDIIDIFNIIARCVVSGNVRRSSQICLSRSKKVLDCKNYQLSEYDYRRDWSHYSNNSYLHTGTEPITPEKIHEIMENVNVNGEPGILFQDNVKRYGRINDLDYTSTDRARNLYLDPLANGTNPCGEISLEGTSENASRKKFNAGGETCNLVETYPFKFFNTDHELMYKDYCNAMFYAVLYAKAITLVPVHWKITAEIQNRNRRIGVSQTGIVMLLEKLNWDYEVYAKFCDRGYDAVCKADKKISKMLNINTSNKKTTVKPSGTVSMCADCTHGMHYPAGNIYIRRVRYSKTYYKWTKMFKNAGYHVEDDIINPTVTSIVEFPVKSSHNIVSKRNVSLHDQFKLLKIIQKHWSDNQVSCTINYNLEEAKLLEQLIYENQHLVKSLSFLPNRDYSLLYKQMPEEEISLERYNEIIKNIKPINFDLMLDKKLNHLDEETDNMCDGDKCVL